MELHKYNAFRKKKKKIPPCMNSKAQLLKSSATFWNTSSVREYRSETSRYVIARYTWAALHTLKSHLLQMLLLVLN